MLRDPAGAVRAARFAAALTAAELVALGINMSCAPVLDLPGPGGHDVIGDRAYGTSPERVIALGRAVADGLLAGGVLPVIKHIPGHGRATKDSHLELPTVAAARQDLERFGLSAISGACRLAGGDDGARRLRRH